MRLRFIFLSCAVFFIVGCESTLDKFSKSDEYKKSVSHNDPLVIPKDLNKEVIEDRYPMPRVECEDEGHSSVIPPGSKIK